MGMGWDGERRDSTYRSTEEVRSLGSRSAVAAARKARNDGRWHGFSFSATRQHNTDRGDPAATVNAQYM